MIDPDNSKIDELIQEIKDLNYDVTDEGDLEDYLGITIEKIGNKSFKMSQPQMIQQILQDLNLEHSNQDTKRSRYQTKTKDIPAPSTVILNRDKDGPAHKEKWPYHSVIGKLNFLEKSSRPDFAFAVHNAAQFSADPKECHSQAVKQIGRYLLGNKDKGIIMTPDTSKSLEVYADADFCGLYDPDTALYNPATAKS